MILDFEHHQAAHCENGVTSNLLKYYGVEVSEAMAFGIGSGIFFIYLPFLKLNGLPVTSFRPFPGRIFQRTAAHLGIKICRKKFRDPDESMKALDKALDAGIPVGLQVGVFHLIYFPRPYRFHFNAHNIVVYGKDKDRYLISDPVMEHPESLTYEELKRARWARGAFQPRDRCIIPSGFPPGSTYPAPFSKGFGRAAGTCWPSPYRCWAFAAFVIFRKKSENGRNGSGEKRRRFISDSLSGCRRKSEPAEPASGLFMRPFCRKRQEE